MTSTLATTPASPRAYRSLSERLSFWIPLALYLVLAAVLWRPFQYVMYKDEVTFIAIAERYARGDWDTAPNVFWPPLLSWLEASLFSLGIPVMVAVKMVSVLNGIPAYVALCRLLRALHVGRDIRVVFQLIMVPCLVYFAYFAAGADLLLVGLLGLYVSITLRPAEARTMSQAVGCGVLGALSYFCKGYALYFFLAHYVLVALWDLVTAPHLRVRMTTARTTLAGLAVAGMLIAPWVAVLRAQYGMTTLGVIGSYNYAMRAPGLPDVPPATYLGFIEPPPDTTVSVLEEPIHLHRMLKPWSPLESARALRHQLELIATTVDVTLSSLQQFTVLWAAILAGAVLLWAGPAPAVLRRPLGLTLLTIALYPAGYLLVHMEGRYLWPVQLLLLCLAAVLIQHLWTASWFRRPYMRWAALGAVTLSFILFPIHELREHANEGRGIDQVRERVALEEQLHGARLASNRDYGGSVLLAYRLGARYYGQPKPRDSVATVEADLVRLGVDYYLAWDGTRVESPRLRLFKEFRTGGRVLTIYSVQPHSHAQSVE